MFEIVTIKDKYTLSDSQNYNLIQVNGLTEQQVFDVLSYITAKYRHITGIFYHDDLKTWVVSDECRPMVETSLRDKLREVSAKDIRDSLRKELTEKVARATRK